MGQPLTARQQQVYDYIRERISTRGYGPTVREIGEFIGIKSPNGVVCHLRALERKGMIRRVANKSRAIELVEPLAGDSALEVRGIIEQGVFRPFEAPTITHALKAFSHPERYLLYYRGYEMGHRSILDGDLLLVQSNTCASASLQLIENANGKVAFRDTHSQFASQESDSEKVVGFVVGVIRVMAEIATTLVHAAHSRPPVAHVLSHPVTDAASEPSDALNGDRLSEM